MNQKILIVQHTPWQPPGPVLLHSLAESGCEQRVVEVWRESAADFADYDALILLGGACAFDQEERFPCLREEKRLVRAWVNLNRPCLGFSLGCHLLADAAGATIAAGHLPSMGIIDGHFTHAVSYTHLAGATSPMRGANTRYCKGYAIPASCSNGTDTRFNRPCRGIWFCLPLQRIAW